MELTRLSHYVQLDMRLPVLTVTFSGDHRQLRALGQRKTTVSKLLFPANKTQCARPCADGFVQTLAPRQSVLPSTRLSTEVAPCFPAEGWRSLACKAPGAMLLGSDHQYSHVTWIPEQYAGRQRRCSRSFKVFGEQKPVGEEARRCHQTDQDLSGDFSLWFFPDKHISPQCHLWDHAVTRL